MTEEEILQLLIDLNNESGLVIFNGETEPFWIVNRVGWHEPTRQIVFEIGIPVPPGDDTESREQVVWHELG